MQKKIICTTWLVIFLFAAGMPMHAQEIKSLPKLKKISPISPVPEVKKISPVPEEVKWIKMSDAELYGICTIDRIGKNEIVLDDDLYRVSPNVTFYAESGKPLKKSNFRVGNKIGFTMNGKEIISIWKLNKQSRR